MPGVSVSAAATRVLAEVKDLNRSLAPLRQRALRTTAKSFPGLYAVLAYVQPRRSIDFRPILFRSAFELGRSNFKPALPVALSLQLANTATLVTDDILDHSTFRDGRPCAHVAFGPERALLASVLLKSLASTLFFKTISSVRSLSNRDDAYRCFENAWTELHRGQYLDLRSTFPAQIDERTYFRVIDLTTGRLMEASAAIGGLLSGMSAHAVGRLAEFGRIVGVIHQLRDDLVDYFPDRYELGRPAGEDLRERRLRLPVVFALRLNSEAGLEFRQLMEKKQLMSRDVSRARRLLDASGAFEYVRQRVQELSVDAERLLARLPVEKPVRRLRALLEYLKNT